MSVGIAVVTGAARGIGAEIARRLAADGYDLAVLDRQVDGSERLKEEIQQQGRRVLVASLEVTDECSVKQAVADVVAKLGPPTVLVNNAGVMKSRMTHRLSVEDWELVIDVNLKGAFLMSREVIPHMKTLAWGRIINLSSMGALGLAGSSNYAAAKAGVQGLTKSLSLELGRHNITVNAVAPGFVVTDMTRQVAEAGGQTVEALALDMAKDVAVGRAGTAADIAHVVSFFADERSSYISGQILYATGGPKT